MIFRLVLSRKSSLEFRQSGSFPLIRVWVFNHCFATRNVAGGADSGGEVTVGGTKRATEVGQVGSGLMSRP